MIARFADTPLLSCETYEPRVGRLRARLLFAEAPTKRKGTLQIGSRLVRGTLVDVGPSNGNYAATFYAGADGWRAIVPPQAWRGVSRADVVRSVAQAVGETVSLAPELSSVRFDSYRFEGGRASEILSGISWWVDDAGITQAGIARPSRDWTPAEISVEGVDNSGGTLRARSAGEVPRPGDRVFAIDTWETCGDVHADGMGGLLITLASAPTLVETLRLATASAPPSTVRGELRGALWEIPGGAPLPAAQVPAYAGPGVTVTPDPSGSPRALIAFVAGDRGAPYAAAWDASPPLRYELSAQTIALGYGGPHVPAARAPEVIAALSALAQAASSAAGVYAAIIPPAPVTSAQIAATLAALAASLSSLAAIAASRVSIQ